MNRYLVSGSFFAHSLFHSHECQKIHHDYIPHQRNRQCGPRILTLFIYLNDVPAGGETFFPLSPKGGDRNVTVKPKRGMALLFPNVRDNGTYPILVLESAVALRSIALCCRL